MKDSSLVTCAVQLLAPPQRPVKYLSNRDHRGSALCVYVLSSNVEFFLFLFNFFHS